MPFNVFVSNTSDEGLETVIEAKRIKCEPDLMILLSRLTLLFWCKSGCNEVLEGTGKAFWQDGEEMCLEEVDIYRLECSSEPQKLIRYLLVKRATDHSLSSRCPMFHPLMYPIDHPRDNADVQIRLVHLMKR